MKNYNGSGKYFYLVALGCPKNLVDSEIISGNLLSSGWGMAMAPEEADLYIINTCAFIPSARNEAAEEIAFAAQWKNEAPGRQILVSGCLSQYTRDIRKDFPQVDFWAGVDDVPRIAEILQGKACSDTCTYLHDENTPLLQLTMPHIAYVKIADGCDNCCSYCIIPRLRGKLRSRPAQSIVNEIANLVANGVKEVIIVAQDVTAFGMDRPQDGENLAGLLRQIEEIEGSFCVRLLYTHPAHYTDELIDVLKNSQKVLPYLDMPLQHISDRILREMNRHITSDGIKTLLKKLRKNIPGLVLRTTFITGLPGETEAEFEELENFIREQKFERMGVFPYAPEPGSPAGAMPDIPPVEVAEARATKLMKAQIGRMKRRSTSLIGSEMVVLVDQVTDGVAVARGVWDAPDIDNVVLIPDDGKIREGNRLLVRVTGRQGCDSVAEKLRKIRK
ncbi:MAG: 30S ribosomal protein S12 methylthiotransferase RimO [Lentisphaeria bacterium]|nr:30S ribosomal protein S12 methylthiotransferase RimO [Lentisphaeria bacterium]